MSSGYIIQVETDLNAVEWSDNVDGSVLLRLAGLLRLLGQLDQRAGHALQLAHVLSALANDAAHLGRSDHDLDGQPHIFSARHEAFFAHLLEDQVLSLK